MTRGKRSTASNARLRQRLADAELARRRLEHRIVEAERERDAAIEWRANAERDGLPAINAERERADAAHALATKATETERQWWEERCDKVAPSFLAMSKAIPGNTRVFNDGDVEAWADLLGETVGEALAHHDPIPGGGARVHRRNSRSGAAVRRIMKFDAQTEPGDPLIYGADKAAKKIDATRRRLEAARQTEENHD